MFSKLINKLFKETTNIADISPVTFNSPGTYNPRYGKSKITFVGRGGSGSYSPAYENGYSVQANQNASNSNTTVYVPGVQFSASANVSDATNHVTLFTGSASGFLGSAYGVGKTTVNGGWYFTNNSGPITTNSTWTIAFDGNGGSSLQFASGSSTSGNLVQNTWVNSANLTSPATIVPGNWNTSYWNYTYISTGYYPAVTATGPSYTFDGITVPGGYGTTASDISPTQIPYRDLWMSQTVTIPSGGYATINFSL